MSWSLVPGSERVGRSLDALTKKTTRSSKCHSGSQTNYSTFQNYSLLHHQWINPIFFKYLSI